LSLSSEWLYTQAFMSFYNSEWERKYPPLSRKSWIEPQALECWINWEIYTPYSGAAEMFLHINGKFIIEKFKWSPLSYSFVLSWLSLSISRCRSRYEADLAVSVVSFIWSSMGNMRSIKSARRVILWQDITYIAEREIKGLG